MSPALDRLRARIARIEGVAQNAAAPSFATPWPGIDAALPWRGLPRGAVHEILAGGSGQDAAATGFAMGALAALAAAAPGLIVWASCRRDLFAPGLVARGLDPGRILIVRAAGGAEILWVAEEALRGPGTVAAVAETGAVDFPASRRLQLAAAASGTTLFLLRPGRDARIASAAVTRWRVAPSPGGLAVDLLRCRGGRPGRWLLRGGQPEGNHRVTETQRRKCPGGLPPAAAGISVPL